MSNQYEQLRLNLDSLLLDPNNPRCITSLDIEGIVPDSEIPAKQQDLLNRFDATGTSEFFSVKNLIESFTSVGYVPIDKIVVRELGGGLFVVLEGNRRVSALKILQGQSRKGLELSDSLLADMESLPVLRIKTEGLTEEDVAHSISVMLGIRHHGSLLEWAPLPKAFNIYSSYVSIEPAQNSFAKEQSRINEVSARLSIKPREVREGLMSYIAFQQIKHKTKGVKDHHFSLIQSLVKNAKVNTHRFIEIDKQSTFKLDEDSIELIDRICQFDIRDKLNPDQKLLPDPQTVSILGNLVEKARTSAEESIRSLAQQKLDEVIAGEIDPETGGLRESFDGALNWVIDRETATLWKEEITNLLEKQKTELEVGDFHGDGNELLELEELKKSTLKLQRILAIPD